MSYAQGRVISDADSHIMESEDWLSVCVEATFEGLSEEGRDRFYRRNFEDMFLSA